MMFVLLGRQKQGGSVVFPEFWFTATFFFSCWCGKGDICNLIFDIWNITPRYLANAFCFLSYHIVSNFNAEGFQGSSGLKSLFLWLTENTNMYHIWFKFINAWFLKSPSRFQKILLHSYELPGTIGWGTLWYVTAFVQMTHLGGKRPKLWQSKISSHPPPSYGTISTGMGNETHYRHNSAKQCLLWFLLGIK